MKLLALSGSLRQASLNTQLLHAASLILPEHIEFTLAQLSDIPLYNEDLDTDSKPQAVIQLLTQIRSADVLLLASPEYNHGTTGALKNAIDWASRPAFNSPLSSKKIGLLTAAMSPVGGARAHADLKNMLSATLSLVFPYHEYLLGNAHLAFNKNGELIDEAATRRLARYLNALTEWVKEQ